MSPRSDREVPLCAPPALIDAEVGNALRRPGARAGTRPAKAAAAPGNFLDMRIQRVPHRLRPAPRGAPSG